MWYANWHEYVLLTKRVARAVEILPHILRTYPGVWDHVRFGVSIEDHDSALEMMEEMGKITLSHKWVSLEPMIGPVDFARVPYMNQIGQITLGGESGHGARPMHPEWARAIRDYCKNHGIPFWFKQWGEWAWGTKELYDDCVLSDPRKHQFDDELCMLNVGKKMAGHSLDGVEHQEWFK